MMVRWLEKVLWSKMDTNRQR